MHPVSEVSALLEEVVVLDNGRFVTQSPVDALRGRGSSTVGPAAAATSSPTVSPCALRSDSVAPGPPRSSATSTPHCSLKRLLEVSRSARSGWRICSFISPPRRELVHEDLTAETRTALPRQVTD